MYHVTLDPEGPGVIRLHLRRKGGLALPWGGGPRNMLWINGAQLLFLDGSSADIVQALIDVINERIAPGREVGEREWETIRSQAARIVCRIYPGVTPSHVEADIDHIYGLIVELAKGGCPAEKGVSAHRISTNEWAAPARMDLMISSMRGTGCQNQCAWCYASDMPGVPELDTAQWMRIMDKLWDAGVPMINFTGGEPTLRDDLVTLVKHAERFVTGLITNGRRLAGLVPALKQASLDYVQVSIESEDEVVHDSIVMSPGAWGETVQGIKAAVEAGMYISTNTTLTRSNVGGFKKLIIFLREMGVRYVSCNTLIPAGRAVNSSDSLEPSELTKVLLESRELTESHGMEFSWFTPTCYRELNPLELGLGIKSCSACQTNMAIRPDGLVVPCQSWLHDSGLGNMLDTPWKEIWNHPLARKLRGHGFARPECGSCEHLDTCGGGCPLETINRRLT